MIRLISALDRKRGIAKGGIMPWYIPLDETYFTDQTKKYGANVLTGGRTFRESYKGPLADRHNYILTRQEMANEGITLVHELNQFLKNFSEDLWVAGGAEIYKNFLDLGVVDEIYLTLINADFNCDKFFPEYEAKYYMKESADTMEQNGFSFKYAKYILKPQ
jgi:dihydrofolate reductase